MNSQVRICVLLMYIFKKEFVDLRTCSPKFTVSCIKKWENNNWGNNERMSLCSILPTSTHIQQTFIEHLSFGIKYSVLSDV